MKKVILFLIGTAVLLGAELIADEVLFRLQAEKPYEQIPRSLRRNIRIKPLGEGAVEVSSKTESKYCSLTMPFDLPAPSGTVIRFDFRVLAERKVRPGYVGITFEDQEKKSFFIKKNPAELWTSVVLPVEKLTSSSGEVFMPGNQLRQFRIYARNVEAVPAGAVKLQVRNFQVISNPDMTANTPDRLSYSANLLFDWQVFPEAERYEVAYAKDPSMPAGKTRIVVTDRPFLLTDSALDPGMWHYQVTALPQKKVIRRGSIAIPERRHTYRIGSYDFASFGTAPHPRLKKLAQFNIFHDPALLQSLNADLKYQLPPDGEKFQPGADPAIRSRADWLRIYGARVTGAGRTLMRIGQYALVSGDPAAVAKAKELALAVVRNWDPEKASSRDNLDLAAGNLLMGLGFCYDAAYGIMTPEERKEVDEGLMIRGRQFWKFIHPFRGNEAQNHSWDNTHSFAFASVVCDSAPEERAVWFDYALQLYTYRFLPSLGFDGENNEGLAYWRFGFNLVTRYLDLARQAAGINLYALDYVRKTGNFGLYSAPLAGYEMSFGDNGTPNHHGIWTYSRALCRKLAIETASPEILWYASIPRSGSLEAQVPLAMAQSVTYPHIGVSFFNTFLPDARENVAVGFHSGKYFAGHQHADQNSFSINAYGDKLIVDGGYYDWWGSAHFYSYATTTRAHNTLLINGNGQAERAEGADGVTRYFADSPAFGYVCGDASNPAIYGGRLQKFNREMLFVKPDAVLTFDRVQAQPGAVWSYLLHAQGEKPVLEADGSFRINRQYAHLRGKWLAPAEVKVEQAYDTPPNDMLSSSMLDFHEKEWIIQADFKGENFLTAMEIRPSGKPAALDFERRETPTAVGVSAQGLLAAFRRGDSGRFTLDGIVSDGRMAAVRTDASGNVIGALLAEGTFLEYRGKKLCQLAAAGNWSFPAEQSYSKEEKKESLTWNDAPIPAELHTVIQGDGSRSCLLSAKTVIPEDGYLTIHAPEMPHYIAGKDGRRYAGRAPRTHWVEKGEYLFSFAGAAAGKVKLQFVPAQFLAAKVLPESVVPGEGTVLLEAETPSAWEGEELYVIGRDFCSGGKFGFRFHQSDQNLIWHFAVKDPGQYRLVIAGASTMALLRDLRLPDGRTVALKMPSSGGDGRAKEDWKWYEFPEILTLDAGENTLEMRFNHGIGALDAVFLIPVKQ